MSEVPEKTSREPARKAKSAVAARKPYRPPTFECERVFETMALACGKLHPNQGQCRFNRKNS